ncbi:H-type small acid-soluble spore protein [Lentibacillus sp. N15]|uniref:H-type small acid-soluble spore protein n=1 Tax=Lentibacillus songyuanensis TaxID=3136161 RepID=UPI0031BB6499
MDKQRAQEIMESLPMINVHYHGIPVYIEAVHPSDETATVFPLDEMSHTQTVELNGLNERTLGEMERNKVNL